NERQEPLALLLGAEAQQERTALSVADPVGAKWGAGREQFLDNGISLQRRTFMAAVGTRPGHADPATTPELTTELAIETRPRMPDQPAAPVAARLRDEGADLAAQRQQLGRECQRGEMKRCGHSVPPIQITFCAR